MKPLHITSGDIAGGNLEKSGVEGEVFVWHDILYDGPRNPGWPEEKTLESRAAFLEGVTGGGLGRQLVLDTLKTQYLKLESARGHDGIVLWFDACLFDQSMLCHILTCMKAKGIDSAELICIDAFPGIEPFVGIGQLRPDQLASKFDERQSVTDEQFSFAERVDRAFALQDRSEFAALASYGTAPLAFVPAAVARWILEQPDEKTGLGRLEQLALEAINAGHQRPREIFQYVARHDIPPQYWGDTTLWAKINNLATRNPPLVKITGPTRLLPQWHCPGTLESFCIEPIP